MAKVNAYETRARDKAKAMERKLRKGKGSAKRVVYGYTDAGREETTGWHMVAGALVTARARVVSNHAMRWGR